MRQQDSGAPARPATAALRPDPDIASKPMRHAIFGPPKVTPAFSWTRLGEPQDQAGDACHLLVPRRLPRYGWPGLGLTAGPCPRRSSWRAVIKGTFGRLAASRSAARSTCSGPARIFMHRGPAWRMPAHAADWKLLQVCALRAAVSGLVALLDRKCPQDWLTPGS